MRRRGSLARPGQIVSLGQELAATFEERFEQAPRCRPYEGHTIEPELTFILSFITRTPRCRLRAHLGRIVSLMSRTTSSRGLRRRLRHLQAKIDFPRCSAATSGWCGVGTRHFEEVCQIAIEDSQCAHERFVLDRCVVRTDSSSERERSKTLPRHHQDRPSRRRGACRVSLPERDGRLDVACGSPRSIDCSCRCAPASCCPSRGNVNVWLKADRPTSSRGVWVNLQQHVHRQRCCCPA